MLLWIFLFSSLHGISCYLEDLPGDIKRCKPDCSSKIYCSGEILHDVQMSEIYPDGTTFVQKRMLYPENEIVKKYKKLKQESGGIVSAEKLHKFVDENFEEDDSIVNTPSPSNFPDYKPHPSILNKTDKHVYKEWLRFLNENWLKLGCRVSEEVKKNGSFHSYLYVPNVFIRAGGRFKEMYYWDSYWIIRGLLMSEMYDTARGMIENIVELIRKYEHMPNGNRIYYITRSQPPMLMRMAADYYNQTKNETFMKANLAYFDKEFKWWVDHRSVTVYKNGKNYTMFRYKSLSCTPRPESYLEDYTLLNNDTTNRQKVKIFTGIRSAAESGWDFSTRHMRSTEDKANGKLGLVDMEPQHMVYVDINSIIQSNARLLQIWHDKFDTNKSQAQYYKKMADDLIEAIDQVLWNNETGVWQDYDLKSNKHRDYYYVSNFTPLWSGTIELKNPKRAEYVEKVIKYLQSTGIIDSDFMPKYHCIPTSLNNSTDQQWDYPNCWAPLQAFLIHGLRKNADIYPQAEQIAFNFAQKWIDTTYEGFQKEQKMYEKYNAIDFGRSGAGGEYDPQEGFGWTNAVCMEIFQVWGNKIREPASSSSPKKK